MVWIPAVFTNLEHIFFYKRMLKEWLTLHSSPEKLTPFVFIYYWTAFMCQIKYFVLLRYRLNSIDEFWPPQSNKWTNAQHCFRCYEGNKRHRRKRGWRETGRQASKSSRFSVILNRYLQKKKMRFKTFLNFNYWHERKKLIWDPVHTVSVNPHELIRLCLWLILLSFTLVSECRLPWNQEVFQQNFSTKETTLKELVDETTLIAPHSSIFFLTEGFGRHVSTSTQNKN